MDHVSDASRTVIQTTSWATVALVAVAALATVALCVGMAALARQN